MTAPTLTPTVQVTLTIENTYEDGTVTTVVEATVPPPPPWDGDGYEDWKDDHIFPLTGTGRVDGDAWYDVEVTASSDPKALPVGTTYEFGY